MEILDPRKKVFVVSKTVSDGIIHNIDVLPTEIEGCTVSKNYNISYQTSEGWFQSSLVFDTKDAAVSCVMQQLKENLELVLGDNIKQDVEQLLAKEKQPEPVVSKTIQVKVLRAMDNIIRCVNDEETGVFDDWIALHVPDGASDEDLRDFVEDSTFYIDACEFFARRVAFLLDEGTWNNDGWSCELWRKQ